MPLHALTHQMQGLNCTSVGSFFSAQGDGLLLTTGRCGLPCASKAPKTCLLCDDRQLQAGADCLGERKQEGVEGGRLHVGARELLPHTLHDLPHLVHETRCLPPYAGRSEVVMHGAIVLFTVCAYQKCAVSRTAFCKVPDMLSHLNFEELTLTCTSVACVMQQLTELFSIQKC
jgi:hypothetical protein